MISIGKFTTKNVRSFLKTIAKTIRVLKVLRKERIGERLKNFTEEEINQAKSETFSLAYIRDYARHLHIAYSEFLGNKREDIERTCITKPRESQIQQFKDLLTRDNVKDNTTNLDDVLYVIVRNNFTQEDHTSQIAQAVHASVQFMIDHKDAYKNTKVVCLSVENIYELVKLSDTKKLHTSYIDPDVKSGTTSIAILSKDHDSDYAHLKLL